MMKNVGLKIFLPWLMSLSGYFILYALNIFLANHMAPSLYGDYSLAFRLLNLSAVLLLLGTNVLSNKFLSRYLKKGDSTSALRYVSWNLNFITKPIYTIILASCIFFCVIWILHCFNIKDFASYHLTLYILWISPLAGLSVLLSNYLLSNNNVLISSFFMEVGLNLILFIIFAVSILLLNHNITMSTITIVLFIVFLLIGSIQLFIAKRYLPILNTINLKKLKNDEISDNLEWQKVAYHYIANTTIYYFICFADLWLVELFHPSEHAVAHYAAIIVISTFLITLSGSIFYFIKPEISHLIEKKDSQKKLQRLVTIGSLFNASIIIVSLTGIIAFNQTLLSHFGPDYTNASTALIILVLGYAFRAIVANPCMPLLTFGGHERTLATSAILEAVTLVILGLILTYYYGIVGTSMATAIALVVKALIFYITVRKKMAIKPFGLF